MKEYTYITLREKPEIKNKAAEWFNQKWGPVTDNIDTRLSVCERYEGDCG